jgi:hypothetical protein
MRTLLLPILLLLLCRTHPDTTLAPLDDVASTIRQALASGAADKTIIIWTSKAEGILKYSHNDAIQCLAGAYTRPLSSST